MKNNFKFIIILLSTQINTDTNNEEKFKWDSVQQNIILGSFFWGYVLTELPGGRLAEMIGGHRVFGHSMLWASVNSILTGFNIRIFLILYLITLILFFFSIGFNISNTNRIVYRLQSVSDSSCNAWFYARYVYN